MAKGSAKKVVKKPAKSAKPGAKPQAKKVVAKKKSTAVPSPRNDSSRAKKPSLVQLKSARPAGIKLAKPSRPMKIAKPAPVEPAYIPPVPQRVTSDEKRRKNQAGLSAKELDHFRDLLLEKRRELVGDMSAMEREALRSTTGSSLSSLPLHMADMGTDNYEQEFTLGLVEKDRNLLREINEALAKIQSGTYGICEGTGKPISKPRLEAQPWAKYSIEHARSLEKNLLRR